MLTFTNLIPIFLVFILYFLGMPIVYALFGSTFIYFLFINTTVQPWTILQKVMNSTGDVACREDTAEGGLGNQRVDNQVDSGRNDRGGRG